jgi:hypothetical protein
MAFLKRSDVLPLRGIWWASSLAEPTGVYGADFAQDLTVRILFGIIRGRETQNGASVSYRVD